MAETLPFHSIFCPVRQCENVIRRVRAFRERAKGYLEAILSMTPQVMMLMMYRVIRNTMMDCIEIDKL